MNTALKKAQAALQAKRDAGESVGRKNHIEKWEEKNTRANAINAFCVQCMGGVENEGYQSLIRTCPAPKCPLYNWRPYK